MKWVKANERLPQVSDETLLVVKVSGHPLKQLAYLNNEGVFVVDNLVAETFLPERIQWLDESPSPSIEELAQKLREANPYPENNKLWTQAWNECVDEMIKLSKEQANG